VLALCGCVEWTAADHSGTAQNQVEEADSDHRDTSHCQEGLGARRIAITPRVYYARSCTFGCEQRRAAGAVISTGRIPLVARS
jgi:hypothetical protein